MFRAHVHSACLASALLVVCMPAFAQRAPLLLETAAPAGPRSEPAPTTIRSRAVVLDRLVLPGATARAGDVLRLNLFEDADFEMVIETASGQQPGRYVFAGHLSDDPFSSVTFAVNGDLVQANVRSPEHGEYQIRYESGGVHRAIEVDPAAYPACGIGPEHSVSAAPGTAPGVPPQPRGVASVVDVLVVYTASTRAAAGGKAAVEALVDLAITESNDAYQFSLVNLALNLVGTFEVDFDETAGFSAALSSLRNTSDGIMDEVHVARNATGADMVSLFINNFNSCGLAYVMTTLSSGFAASAFSVEHYTCATGNFSFGHELGHNMGATHDLANNPGGALFPFSLGWHWGNSTVPGYDGDYRSIMAYAPGARVQRFSNPGVMFDNGPTGSANVADNALTLNTSAGTVSAWRGTAGWIAVIPVSGVSSSGEEGGPVSPPALPFQLTNYDSTAAAWNASSNQPWATLSTASGGLAPGASQVVTLNFGAGVNALETGTHTAVLTFNDSTNAKSFQYQVNVAIAKIPSQTIQYWYPLNADPGWTRTGAWQFGVPQGLGSHNGDPTSGHTGMNVFGYNLAGDYDDNMPARRLQMGPIDCSELENVSLSFWRWLGVESAPFDIAKIRVSNDGTSWTDIWNHTGPAIADTSWVLQHYDMSAIADGQSTVYVRWAMGATDVSVTYPGWNIDDVAILGDPIDPAPTNDVWVDFDYIGAERGTASQPFSTIGEGASLLNAGGTLHVTAGATSEVFTFDTPMTIIAHGGTVTLGQMP